MGGVRMLGPSALMLVLVGCGGGEEIVRDAGELPVSCVSKVGPGTCPPGSGRYYYDYESDRCRETAASRCGGRTLFDKLDECVRFCGARR